MKKTFIIAITLASVVGLAAVGVVFAQDGSPPIDGRGPGDGSGDLHEYMEAAMAEVLGLSLDEFEEHHDRGERFYEIALSEGFSTDEIPALMQEARASALAAAVKDGLLTQEQADWMESRGFGRGGMHGGFGQSYSSGECPMFEDGNGYQGFGRGMHGGFGRRW